MTSERFAELWDCVERHRAEPDRKDPFTGQDIDDVAEFRETCKGMFALFAEPQGMSGNDLSSFQHHRPRYDERMAQGDFSYR